MLKIACPQCRQLVARTCDLRRCMRAVSSLWQRSERLNFSTSVRKHSAASSTKIDLAAFPPENIRNFSIIAHVDHGKSTLADRLLELTGTIPTCVDNQQVLDRLQVERERGITVKAQTASLLYDFEGKTYLLNLIDTPGHVDFNYEVCRSLSACQGVVLLVDANQGVQAQTVANFYLAFEMEKVILPVLNKIDLKNAKPDTVIKQLHTLFEIESEAVLKVSAKFGTGITELIAAIIQRIPPPSGDSSKPLKALVFDSWYDRFKGAIVNVALFDGILAKGDKIVSASTTKTYEVQEVGILHPLQESTQIMYAGQVGYVIANIRDIHETHIGDTFYHSDQPVEPLAGFQPAKPMVFAGIYPPDQSEYDMLRKAIEKLILNDSSVTVYPDSSPALGQGWRLGFLGLLHMEVFNQRLEQEYNMPVIATAPNVPYRVKIFGSKHIKKYRTDELTIVNPCHLPSPDIINEYLEPMVLATIITPDAYLGCITSLYLGRRGIQKDQYYIDGNRILIKVILPLNEILIDFYDELKSATSGYASFDYEDHGYQTSSLVKVMFLLNGKEVEELTMISHTLKARQLGKEICAKLKDIIPQQLFTITIQAAVGAKIIAREDVKALRKDVTAKCYGGDVSRKKKLLKRQAEGKKRMRRIGNIEIPKDAFMKVLKK